MAFSDVLGLFSYWAKFPPVHILVRGFIGYEPPEEEESQANQTTGVSAPSDMDRQQLAGMPGLKLNCLPDWQREALERLLGKPKKEPVAK